MKCITTPLLLMIRRHRESRKGGQHPAGIYQRYFKQGGIEGTMTTLAQGGGWLDPAVAYTPLPYVSHTENLSKNFKSLDFK